jgi:hypothetical protein
MRRKKKASSQAGRQAGVSRETTDPHGTRVCTQNHRATTAMQGGGPCVQGYMVQEELTREVPLGSHAFDFRALYRRIL